MVCEQFDETVASARAIGHLTLEIAVDQGGAQLFTDAGSRSSS